MENPPETIGNHGFFYGNPLQPTPAHRASELRQAGCDLRQERRGQDNEHRQDVGDELRGLQGFQYRDVVV